MVVVRWQTWRCITAALSLVFLLKLCLHRLNTVPLHPAEQYIVRMLAKQHVGYGDNGTAVQLSGADRLRGEQDYETFATNVEASDQIPFNRPIPDVRVPWCRQQNFDDLRLTASVVIIAYNEALSLVLRTVHSVLRTSDRRWLKEVIVVDDGSVTEPFATGVFEYYVRTRLPAIVQVLRQTHQGLIRARLAGARRATGDVLVFLDAHCECADGWLPPLLQRISESSTSVVVPQIAEIDPDDFSYKFNPNDNRDNIPVGGFMWDSEFDWFPLSVREVNRLRGTCTDRPPLMCPVRTPTMAGGLFAIDRLYFWHVGSYDDHMTGWGGENLEMSFRIWQCGGTIELLQCSKVGHMFRMSVESDGRSVGEFPQHVINAARMARVWMDEYIEMFYVHWPELRNHWRIGDISERQQLRQQLECKDFAWYLRNVWPEKFVPFERAQHYGQVRLSSTAADLCLALNITDEQIEQYRTSRSNDLRLSAIACAGSESEGHRRQLLTLTDRGVLRNEIFCVTVDEQDDNDRLEVRVVSCMYEEYDTDMWTLTEDGRLQHRTLDVCMDQDGVEGEGFVYARPCLDARVQSQRWHFIDMPIMK